jgi:hypothetical protein
MLDANALVPLFLFLGIVTVFTARALGLRRLKGWQHDNR